MSFTLLLFYVIIWDKYYFFKKILFLFKNKDEYFCWMTFCDWWPGFSNAIGHLSEWMILFQHLRHCVAIIWYFSLTLLLLPATRLKQNFSTDKLWLCRRLCVALEYGNNEVTVCLLNRRMLIGPNDLTTLSLSSHFSYRVPMFFRHFFMFFCSFWSGFFILFSFRSGLSHCSQSISHPTTSDKSKQVYDVIECEQWRSVMVLYDETGKYEPTQNVRLITKLIILVYRHHK